MNTKSKRQLIQGSLFTFLFICFIKSKSNSLVITAYLVIVMAILDPFLYIRNKELDNDSDPGNNFWIQSLTFLILQLLVIATVFGLTWYLIEKRLKWI
jgi:hypothetical protein